MNDLEYRAWFWGSADTQGLRYGEPPPKGVTYAKGYHRGEDRRVLNSTGQYSIVADIPVLTPGRIAGTGRGGAVGFWTAVDTGRRDGRYEIYCHELAVTAPRTGEVRPGDIIARMAGARENPGTAWTAPHVHLVISDSLAGADASYNDYDPQPFIQAALASTAGSGGVDFTPKGWLEMLSDAEQRQLYANVQFLTDQANGYVSKDRPAEGQLATAISRVTEILFAVDGQADPRIVGSDKQPVVRRLAAFLRTPNVNATVDPTPIANAIREAVAGIPGVDQAAVERAAEAGARAALAGLTLKAEANQAAAT